MPNKISLRYGNNPHQQDAQCVVHGSALDILNGRPSYINLLDILTGWQIVRDVWLSSSLMAATSIKHCAPVGVAVPGAIDSFTSELLGLKDCGPALSAYLRARSSDWAAAYGDMIVLYGEVDSELAGILSRLVFDGIAATSFSPEALAILKRKKSGRYLVVQLDKEYVPPVQESREIMGIELSQPRNNHIARSEDFVLLAGSPERAELVDLELKLAVATMKYTVSNNIVLASGGRTLAVTAGQQSRVLSTRLACQKYNDYLRLQHASTLHCLRQTTGKLTDKIATAVRFAAGRIGDEYNAGSDTVLASDGFIPFQDNIDLAAEAGVSVILEPVGAMRSDEIMQSVEAYGMCLIRTDHRFFYH